jgi:hypothetical protein
MKRFYICEKEWIWQIVQYPARFLLNNAATSPEKKISKL